MFAYTTGSPTIGLEGKYLIALEKVAVNRPMSEDEVDLDDGFLMVPASVPVQRQRRVRSDSPRPWPNTAWPWTRSAWPWAYSAGTEANGEDSYSHQFPRQSRTGLQIVPSHRELS